MISSLAAVVFVFILGFGWGAAAMVIPIMGRLKIILEWQGEVLAILESVAQTQTDELKVLKRLSDDCGRVILGTKGVVDGVDKLIKEIKDEVREG